MRRKTTPPAKGKPSPGLFGPANHSGAENLDPERARGEGQAPVMGRHDEGLPHSVAPYQSGGQVQGVQRSQGCRKRLGRTRQYRPLEQDEIDGLQPIGYRRAPDDRFLG